MSASFELYQPEEFSMGDFVISGGELPALTAIDGIVRLLPGGLGDIASATGDSFQNDELDHPCYTRPAEFRGLEVPRYCVLAIIRPLKPGAPNNDSRTPPTSP